MTSHSKPLFEVGEDVIWLKEMRIVTVQHITHRDKYDSWLSPEGYDDIPPDEWLYHHTESPPGRYIIESRLKKLPPMSEDGFEEMLNQIKNTPVRSKEPVES